MSDSQEHTNIRLMKTTKTIQELKTEFNKKIETWKRTWADIKYEIEKLNNPARKLKWKSYKQNFQAADRTWKLKDKTEDLDKISKECEKPKKKMGKEHTGTVGCH